MKVLYWICWNKPIRTLKYIWQKICWGYCDGELWNLDHAFAKFMVSRLRRFKDITMTLPPELSEDQWEKILDEMIDTFKCMQGCYCPDKHDIEKIDKGMELFKKHHWHLWY